MSKFKVDINGINTSNIKVLTHEENLELFKRMHEGDHNAREYLVDGNLKLVLSLLKKYNRRVDNMDDLFQIGCLGLIKAIDNFDTSYGVKFSTYCVPMILGEVKRYLRDNNSLRVSRSLKDLAYKSIKVKEQLTMDNNNEPTIEEIAKELEVSPFDINFALESMRDPVSLSEPIYSDGGDTIFLEDQIEDKKQNIDLETKLTINDTINKLNDRQKYIMDQRFIIGKTQMELSKELGVSQAQISRI